MMASPGSKYPTEMQLRTLKLLWDADLMSVRKVRESLAVSRRYLPRTTVSLTTVDW